MYTERETPEQKDILTSGIQFIRIDEKTGYYGNRSLL